MRYVLQNKPAMRLVGTMIRTTLENDAYKHDIQTLFESLQQSGKLMDLVKMINQRPYGLLSASWIINAGGSGDFDFFIGASTTQQAQSGLKVVKIPESRWAVFEVVGPAPESLIEMGDKLISKWLPKGEYKLNEGLPIINVYTSPDIRSPEFKSELWVAILGKNEAEN